MSKTYYTIKEGLSSIYYMQSNFTKGKRYTVSSNGEIYTNSSGVSISLVQFDKVEIQEALIGGVLL